MQAHRPAAAHGLSAQHTLERAGVSHASPPAQRPVMASAPVRQGTPQSSMGRPRPASLSQQVFPRMAPLNPWSCLSSTHPDVALLQGHRCLPSRQWLTRITWRVSRTLISTCEFRHTCACPLRRSRQLWASVSPHWLCCAHIQNGCALQVVMSPGTPLRASAQHTHALHKPYRGMIQVETPLGARPLPASLARHAGTATAVRTALLTLSPCSMVASPVLAAKATCAVPAGGACAYSNLRAFMTDSWAMAV